MLCTVDKSGSIVLHDGLDSHDPQAHLSGLKVVVMNACWDAPSGIGSNLNGSVPTSTLVPADLHGVPAGRYPNTTRARAVLLCSPVDSAPGPSLVRVLSVLSNGSIDMVTVPQQGIVTALAVGDVNSDGAGPDLVLGAGGGGTLTIMSSVDGAWSTVASIATGGAQAGAPTLVELQDLNDDGRCDLEPRPACEPVIVLCMRTATCQQVDVCTLFNNIFSSEGLWWSDATSLSPVSCSLAPGLTWSSWTLGASSPCSTRGAGALVGPSCC